MIYYIQYTYMSLIRNYYLVIRAIRIIKSFYMTAGYKQSITCIKSKIDKI